MEKKLRSITFWFIFLSIIYTILDYIFLLDREIGTIGGHVAGFFGLFTPLGNLVFYLIALGTGSLLSLLYPFILLIVFDFFKKWLIKNNFSLKTSIILILTTLFVMTCLFNSLWGAPLHSVHVFLNGTIEY